MPGVPQSIPGESIGVKHLWKRPYPCIPQPLIIAKEDLLIRSMIAVRIYDTPSYHILHIHGHGLCTENVRAHISYNCNQLLSKENSNGRNLIAVHAPGDYINVLKNGI